MPGPNSIAIKIATVNGSGSSSANNLLMKSIFRMDIPVSGKNLFPSNIQGLPTWYEIRANPAGYTSRSTRADFLVALNAETYAQDIKEVRSGGYLLYDNTWPLDEKLHRDDITLLGIPFSKLCVERFDSPRKRILMKNVAYVGAMAAFLNIDLDIIQEQLQSKYGAKKTLMDANHEAVQCGFDFAQKNYRCPLNIHLETGPKPLESIMIDGNTAAALGCLYAGATVGAWYPITPSTSLMDSFLALCQRYRVDPESGKGNFCVMQAEDEIAAVGMVVGAAWNGARAFTATSGPGISLMNEFVGFAYYAEIPTVIFDVQRVGPSTGMPTRTQQSDLFNCAFAGHGDTRHVLLLPKDPEECFHFAVRAFDLADRLQSPVFVMSDLDIGMNDWMCPTLSWDDTYRPDRGKILSREELEKAGQYFRYVDRDDDGIAPRTLPGTHARGAYLTRGSGHNKYGAYTEDDQEYQEVLERLKRKIIGATRHLPEPVFTIEPGATMAIVSMGSCDEAIREALDIMSRRGTPLDYMRVRSYPFSPAVEEFINGYETVFVIEMNRDAQLKSLLTMDTHVAREKMTSILYYGGLSLSCDHVLAGIQRSLFVPAEETVDVEMDDVDDSLWMDNPTPS
jgi:2-oxoglutarate ferredoxin oxidoreductase subunit alpha